MSKLEVDAIEPQSGTTITIGSSGDTVNLVGTLQSNGSPLPGDISSVVAGTGLSGGGTTGAVTLNIEAAQPTITSLGTITTFRSTGIDDNADATAITINSSEQVILHGGQIQNNNNTSSITYSGGNNSNAGANLTLFGGSHASTPNVARFRSSATEVMRITSAGNVGIGTSSPAKKFHVYGSGSEIARFEATGGNSFIGIKDADDGTIAYIGVDAGKLKFETSGSGFSDKLVIDTAGNVGIGTSSPSAQLHIVGDDVTDQVIIENTDGGNGSAPDLVLFRNSASPADNDVLGRIDFRGDNSAGSAVDYMLMYAQASDITNGTEDVRLIFEGKKAGSNAKLFTIGEDEVIVNDDSNDVDFRVESDNATHALFVQGSNGHIGMNTSSPTYALNIANGAGNMRIKTTDSANVANASTSLLEYHGTDNRAGYVGFVGGDMIIHTDTHSAGNIELETNGAERMRILSDGKVGINTSSPYGKFEVHSGGDGANYAGSSAIKSGVTWGSEASSHTISIFNYNENDNSSGMLLVHAKADSNKCGTLMLLFTKKGGSGVAITTVSSKTDGMSTFSASTSGNNINISTDSDCAICWQSYYGV